MIKELETLGEGAKFKYEWTIDNKIKIYYGKKSTIRFDGKLYDELIRVFKGKLTRIHNHPDEENLHDWIYRHGVKTRIAQYVAPILIWEKHAQECPERGKILIL